MKDFRQTEIQVVVTGKSHFFIIAAAILKNLLVTVTRNLSRVVYISTVDHSDIFTSNQILKRVAMENSMHYSKQNIMDSMSVNAALASLGQQTSHS